MESTKMRKNKRTIFSQALLAAFISVLIAADAGSILAATAAALPPDSLNNTETASSFEDGLTSIQDNSGKDSTEKQPDGSVPSQKKETAAGRWKEKKQQFFYCVKGRRIKGIYKRQE